VYCQVVVLVAVVAAVAVVHVDIEHALS